MMSSFSFSQVPMADIPRSTFNRDHGHKTTFDAGYLVPIFVDEALPGDTFNMSASVFARLATPIVPVMDNLHMDFFFFAVPNRLLWDHWQNFMGEQLSPGDTTDYLVPQVTVPSTGWLVGTLADYFGLPCKAGVYGTSLDPCALPFRAYNLIWNEWFRDQNLQDRVPFNTGDGPDPDTDYTLLKRGKRHDYFTSCLPWPQKGPGVELPIGATAPVIPNPLDNSPKFNFSGFPNPQTIGIDAVNTVPTAGAVFSEGLTTSSGYREAYWQASGLVADLSNATAATINKLREAFQIQRLLERDARGGSRYIEILKSHFGVTAPDFRLQRPEFLGGGSIPVIINPVQQTSGSGTYTETPQGNLAAYGLAHGRIGFSKAFVEHSVIIGLVMVRADLSYQQGQHRMWNRRTRFDFYWPAFAHLGEQSVLNKEIYAQGSSEDDFVFGYQERWAEYRYFPSKITGKFRSDYATSLDVWHLAQQFTTKPVLNAAFIEENPPVDRIIAVQDEPQFIFDSHFSLKCTRPMPMYSVPGLIDHF